MNRYKCSHNSARDVEKTVPGLSVDVGEIMATHVVPSSGDTTPYSKETEVSEVGHYLTDKIQTAMAALRLGASMSKQSTPVAPSSGE